MFFLVFFFGFFSLCFYRKSTSRARFPKPRKKTKRKNKPKNQKQKKIITKKNTFLAPAAGAKPGPFLADRWGTPQSARTNGPAEIGFRDGENGFNAKKSAYASMKLYQVVRAAKDLLQGAPNSPSASGASTGRGLPLTEVLCERSQLVKEYMTKWNVPKPQYRDQGSAAFLKRQYRFCSKGEIGYIQAKHIISALPEEGERPIKTRRKVSVDGWEKEEEEEEEEGAAPITRRQLERLHLSGNTKPPSWRLGRVQPRLILQSPGQAL